MSDTVRIILSIYSFGWIITFSAGVLLSVALAEMDKKESLSVWKLLWLSTIWFITWIVVGWEIYKVRRDGA